MDDKDDDNFKVPLLLPKVSGDTVQKVNDEREKPKKVSASESQHSNAVVSYNEPTWSGSPPAGYMFQIIKSGVIISNLEIQKSYITVGRLTSCDVTLEHPSVSRYHAILQYCCGNDKYPKGFYIYDLGSTHGTFLNKKQIDANTYYLVKIDSMLKFGGSTRLHILLGPEEESEEIPKITEEKPVNEIGESCSWGIGDDAEEDEDDLSINPFAISTENEALYIDDPKKTLRGWFEREGYELEYNVEEKGFRTFVCNVRLPIDTPTGDYMNVEASVNGKKKEAVVACALEACRTLDRHGLLRQSHHESRERKQKKWEDEDFYDSDEDTYLDRTGTIEKKRQFRMMTVKKPEPETFSSLQTKLKDLNDKISLIEKKLQSNNSLNSIEMDADKEDPLDSYMCKIKEQSIDKVTRSKLRLDHMELLKEKGRLEKLLNIAKPTEMPTKKFPNMIGKRIKSKLKLPESRTISKTVAEKNDEPEIEEEEEDEEIDKELQRETKSSDVKISSSEDASSSALPSISTVSSTVPSISKVSGTVPSVSRVSSTVPNVSKGSITLNSNVTESDESETLFVKPNAKEKTPMKHSSSSSVSAESTMKKARPAKGKDVYKAADENYSMWMPPVNQSGDGTTHLNSKYGY